MELFDVPCACTIEFLITSIASVVCRYEVRQLLNFGMARILWMGHSVCHCIDIIAYETCVVIKNGLFSTIHFARSIMRIDHAV